MLHWTLQLVEVIHGCCWIILSKTFQSSMPLGTPVCMEVEHTLEVSISFPQKEPRQLTYRGCSAFAKLKVSPSIKSHILRLTHER